VDLVSYTKQNIMSGEQLSTRNSSLQSSGMVQGLTTIRVLYVKCADLQKFNQNKNTYILANFGHNFLA